MINGRRILLAVAGSIVAAVAFPPYEYRFDGGSILNAGFAPIWAPPTMNSVRLATVNTTLLSIEIVGLCLAAGAILAATRLRD